MDIQDLCCAICANVSELKDLFRGEKTTDEKKDMVDNFRNGILGYLNNLQSDVWEREHQGNTSKTGDSVDIFWSDKGEGGKDWIIELDATRADQVAKKFVSRLALWGLEKSIQYVAILYPNTQKGSSECAKYLRYFEKIIEKINNKSCMKGIFVVGSDRSNIVTEIIKLDKQLYGYNHCVLKSRWKLSVEDTKIDKKLYLSDNFLNKLRGELDNQDWECLKNLCKKNNFEIIEKDEMYYAVHVFNSKRQFQCMENA